MGYDSLQIRIWVNRSFSDSFQTVIIKHSGGNWSGKPYEIHTKYDTNRNIDTVLSYRLINIFPNTSWTNLLNKFKEEKFQDLPNQMDIENFDPRLTDGWMCKVEVADKNSYRFYSYSSPDYYSVGNQSM